MKRGFIGIVLLAATSFAFAAGLSTGSVEAAGFNKMSESQKAEIIRQIANAQTSKVDTVEVLDKYAEIGSRLGKGMVATAKELGVAANEFSTTSLGKITMALIIWHIMGSTLVHIIGGILVWTVGFTVLYFVFKRLYPAEITYDKEKTNIFGNAKILNVKKYNMTSDGISLVIIANAFVGIAGLISIFTF